MRILRSVSAAALVVVAVGLVACGGDDPTPASSGSGGGSGRQGIDAKTRQAMLDFARCMRAHGINMPDPKFDANGGGGIQMQSGGQGTTPEQQKAAEQACAKYQKQIKPPPMSAAEKQKQRQEALANARCMREHGIDMPDPQFDENGGILQKGPNIDPDRAKFKKAEEACRPAGELHDGTTGGAP
jgi:hypothetical protein